MDLNEIISRGVKTDSLYIGDGCLYGGFSFTKIDIVNESGKVVGSDSGYCDYVSIEQIFELAIRLDAKIHLAGFGWEKVGLKGFGEEVTVDAAKNAVDAMSKIR